MCHLNFLSSLQTIFFPVNFEDRPEVKGCAGKWHWFPLQPSNIEIQLKSPTTIAHISWAGELQQGKQ